MRLLAPPSPRGCGTLCAVPCATGAAADILLFGGSCGWEAEAARATTFLGDTHRLPLGEVLDALDQSAATAATTTAAAATTTTAVAHAAGETAAAAEKATPQAAEKENAANAKAKPTHPLADAAAAPAEGAKRSRKQKAPVKRVEGPVESLVQNAAP